jgi:hypothetical protein
MRKVLLSLVCTAVLWVPAVSVAGDSSPSLSLKPAAKTETSLKSDASKPASACRSQLGSPELKFTRPYGVNSGGGRGVGANRFGKCVSTIAMQGIESDGKDRDDSHDNEGAESAKDSINPAVICKTMQAGDLAHFQTTYSTRSNSFGRCVAKQASSKHG